MQRETACSLIRTGRQPRQGTKRSARIWWHHTLARTHTTAPSNEDREHKHGMKLSNRIGHTECKMHKNSVKKHDCAFVIFHKTAFFLEHPKMEFTFGANRPVCSRQKRCLNETSRASRPSAPGTADRRIGENETGKRNTQFDGTINPRTSKWDIGVAVRRAPRMYWFCQRRQISCLFCMPFVKWDERCCWLRQSVRHRRVPI